MIKVYIAGPYTKGDVAINVREALDQANKLADLGFAPFCPHLTHFWHIIFPRPYSFWCHLDLEFLPFCQCVLRIHGKSTGADNEVIKAKELGLPIFETLLEVVNFYGKQV